MEIDKENAEMLKSISEKIKNSARASGGADREKYWKELTPDEKIERMRTEVKGVQRSQSTLWDLVNNFVLQMESHEHLNGKIVSPIRNPIGMGMGMEVGLRPSPSANPDEVYF